MRTYWTLVCRELGAHFFSWTGYVIIAAVAFLIGFSFTSLLEGLNGMATPVPVTQLFYQSTYFWDIFVVVPALITMRSFAHEKASGTYETLMTTPVSETQVVLAKFTGALLFHLLSWLPLLGCLSVIHRYSATGSSMDAGAVGATFLGILLLGSLYTAMGIFASAITRSQIIAGMVSLALGQGLFKLSFLGSTLPADAGWVADLVSHVKLLEHMREFSQGSVDTRQIIFYLTMTALFLVLAWKTVETRRWK